MIAGIINLGLHELSSAQYCPALTANCNSTQKIANAHVTDRPLAIEPRLFFHFERPMADFQSAKERFEL